MRRAQASLQDLRPLTWECCFPSFRGPHSSAPSQNQRFCDGVPVVHFGVPGQEFIIFDWGKFREPHSGFPPPLRHSTCSPSRRRKLRRSSIARLLREQYPLNVARFAPPKILSAGTPNCRDLQAAALPPYHDEGIALVSLNEHLCIFTTRKGATARQTSRPPQCGAGRRLRADCDAGERRVVPSPKEITSCHATSRSEFSLDRLRNRNDLLQHISPICLVHSWTRPYFFII